MDKDNPPLRVLFGSQPVGIVTSPGTRRPQTWSDREHVSRAARD
jgi:hypothetical protein